MTRHETTEPLATDASAGHREMSVGVAFCLLSVTMIQFGSALSLGAVTEFGASGATFMRFAIAGLVLTAIVRPRFRSFNSEQWRSAALLGASMAAMTLCFFSAMPRLPLGLLVAIDFLGPLAVATLGLSGWRLAWPAMALVGVVLLSHYGEGWVGEPTGVFFALGAAFGWAAYIRLLKRTGDLFRGLDGLAASLLAAAACTAPFGLAHAASAVTWNGLATMAGLAILVPLIPYALENAALRRMPTSAFSILMSLEPAAAAVAGAVVLGQSMATLQIVGTAFVVAASVGATRAASG